MSSLHEASHPPTSCAQSMVEQESERESNLQVEQESERESKLQQGVERESNLQQELERESKLQQGVERESLLSLMHPASDTCSTQSRSHQGQRGSCRASTGA